MPNRIRSAATIFGRKPEPGMERPPMGRSPLMANTARPSAMNAPPATWSARIVAIGAAGLALDASDLLDRGLDALGVRVPELGKVRLIHVVEILAEIGQRGL